MIIGQTKNDVDKLWLAFHSGGITNPITVIEQINYLLFCRRLDDIEKSEALARCFKKYVHGSINLAQFKELAAIVDRMFLSDMHALPSNKQPTMLEAAAATRLTACGVLEIYSIPQVKAPEAQTKYVRTPIGNLLYDIFFEGWTRMP